MPVLPPRHCPPGQRSREEQRQNFDRWRGSAASRGYDRKWLAFRSWFINRHPLCQDCDRAGRVEPTTEVHHIAKVRDAPEQRLVETNCMGLCKACHSKRTARGE